MIRISIHQIGLPLAAAMMLSLCACAPSPSGTDMSNPNTTSADAPASPPSKDGSAEALPPVVDPAPVQSPDPSPGSPTAGAMLCDHSKGQSAVGQTATQAVVDKVIADTGARDARVIKPDHMVTMDYREDRVNINVDAQNVITAVKCG